MSVLSDVLTWIALTIFFIFIMLLAINKMRQKLAQGPSHNYKPKKNPKDVF